MRELIGSVVFLLVMLVVIAISAVFAPMNELVRLYRWYLTGRPTGDGVDVWWYVHRGRDDLYGEAVMNTFVLMLGIVVWTAGLRFMAARLIGG